MPTSSKRIALITGGSRGLGRNTVLSLAERGIDSIFTYHSNQAEAGKVVSLAAGAGRQAVALQLDTGKAGTFGPFVKGVRKALADLGAERFDYLVNNAGTSHHAAFDKTTEAELDSLYHVHFKGVFLLTQKILPLMNDGGRIVMDLLGSHAHHLAGKRPLCVHEGRHRGTHPLPGEGVGAE
jgi:NAD(P)-dependent dehydrogenase (short-subunit alcohol dehydrogenase family)